MPEINLLDQTIERAENRSHVTKEKEIKKIVEALLFSSSNPVTLDRLKEIIATLYPIKRRELQSLLIEMNEEYKKEGRAFQIDEIGEGFLLRTTEEVAPYVSLLHQNRRSEKLSQAATEVLAIIAYRGPITRSEIEQLRGVDSSGTVVSLIERGLVERVGKKESPGRPTLYGTSEKFLKYFGIREVQDLNQL
ncbi:MAG: Segregation and condensation protein B [Chlamydiales bacterium]|nr:Segregation and condensation protein B [Chlamydiales bacterium]MCH9619301.1 Segregation and condensation protein B [Chlamydiales bacterium]MCH9622563.1 Segregation and condensation protein B [Chlamydiales bacterium]